MSIFGAMQSGISALASQSSSMGAISDNIANVNTVGYKSNSVAFFNPGNQTVFLQLIFAGRRPVKAQAEYQCSGTVVCDIQLD